MIGLVGFILLGQIAQAQTGFNGSSSFGAGELLGAAMLVMFTGLTLWGFFSGLDALLPPPSLSPQRRLALRWIASSRLEPSITTLLFVIVAVVRMRSETSDSPLSIFWLALPALTFLGLLLPPIWFVARHDALIERTWRGLRHVAAARVTPYMLLGLGLLLDQVWLAVAALVIGLGGLFWSLLLLTRLAAQLCTPQPLSQPVTSS